MRNFALFLLALTSPVVLLYILRRLSSRYGRDDVVDELIARNAARRLEGMETADWRKIDRAGGRTWQTALRGQRRIAAQDKRPETRIH